MKWTMAGATAVLLLTLAPAAAGESFLDSEDYKSGEEAVGLLLIDEEYGKLIQEAEHRDRKLDWAWAAGQWDKRKLESLGFSIGDYRSIVIQPPSDHTMEQVEGLTDRLHEAMTISCKRLGWTPREQGELVLEMAIVDVFDADGVGFTNFFNATGKHSAEFEFRLSDVKTGNILLLVRHETHSANLLGATWRASAHLTEFLAEPSPPRYAARGKTVSLDAYEMPQPKKKKKKKPHQLEKHANPREITLEAMRNSGMFEQVREGSSEADYGLEVNVRDANFVGAYQTTVNVDATYTLTDRRTATVLLEENVATSATLSARDIASGGKRMRQVTPAAFLDNVNVFLFRLDALLGKPNPQDRP